VLLDMDGTLLDLHFDNYFWQEYLPRRYSEIKGMDQGHARQWVIDHTLDIRGSLNWYSTDYWSEMLEVDVIALKHEVTHKIAMRPYCIEFLDALRLSGKDVVMVTNAHHDVLALKMDQTGIADKFDCLITVHEFALPKEDLRCWPEVCKRHTFDPERTLLIDDNLIALASARDFGLGSLLAIYQPDSRRPRQEIDEFDAIEHFDEIMPIS